MTPTLTPDYLRARTVWHAVRRRLRRGRPVSDSLWYWAWWQWKPRQTDLLCGWMETLVLRR